MLSTLIKAVILAVVLVVVYYIIAMIVTALSLPSTIAVIIGALLALGFLVWLLKAFDISF